MSEKSISELAKDPGCSETASVLDEGYLQSRAALLALLRDPDRSLDDEEIRTASGALLDRIPEEQVGPYRTTVFRSLVAAEILEEAGYWEEALTTLSDCLNELHGTAEQAPHIYADLITELMRRRLSLELRLIALDEEPSS